MEIKVIVKVKLYIFLQIFRLDLFWAVRMKIFLKDYFLTICLLQIWFDNWESSLIFALLFIWDKWQSDKTSRMQGCVPFLLAFSSYILYICNSKDIYLFIPFYYSFGLVSEDYHWTSSTCWLLRVESKYKKKLKQYFITIK